jgi:hypothetical protein
MKADYFLPHRGMIIIITKSIRTYMTAALSVLECPITESRLYCVYLKLKIQIKHSTDPGGHGHEGEEGCDCYGRELPLGLRL